MQKESAQNKKIPKQYKYLGLITALYITFQLVSDITAGKIVQLGIFTVSATVLYFPFTYIFADVLTEVYGFAKARSVVWMVLISSVLAGLIYTVVVFLPPAVGFDANDAYTRVLGQIPRILIGGWIAVWVGGILNDYILAKMKVWTKGKHLWTRTIGSTIVGEGVDTALFVLIAFWGIVSGGILVLAIISGYTFKVAYEIIATPITYKIVGFLKKAEDIDFYDTNTKFNPFNLN